MDGNSSYLPKRVSIHLLQYVSSQQQSRRSSGDHVIGLLLAYLQEGRRRQNPEDNMRYSRLLPHGEVTPE